MYIYPHTDSKILKLGFGSMAGYREKKPEWKDGFFNVGLNERIKQWQEQSFIAYLKEPEFTEITYWKVKELYVIKQFNLREHTFIIGDILKTGSYFFQTLSKLFKEGDLSHYYPGQQVGCNHENEIQRQGDGFIYTVCKDCGIDLDNPNTGQQVESSFKYEREVNIERLKAKHLTDDVEPLWEALEKERDELNDNLRRNGNDNQ